MFSKKNQGALMTRFYGVSLVLFCAFLGVQCTPKVGEEPPKQPEQKIEGTACLADALTSFENFAAGNSSESELHSAFGCGTTALVAFKRYVRGRENDRYKTQELATFIEQNFINIEGNTAKFKSTKISTDLQLEVMKIKRLFIGGSVDDLTFPELDQLIWLLSQFEDIAINLNPYMKIYIQKWIQASQSDFGGNEKFFEEGNLALQKSVKELTGLIEKQNPEYVISDAKKLLEEIHKLYNSDWAFLASLDKYLPAVKKLKKALAGGDENIVKPTEWRSFVMLAARGYMQFLRYQYFMTKNIEEDYSKNIVAIFRTLEDVFSTFEDLVNVKVSGVVTTDEINEILSTVSKIWPNIATSESLVAEVMKLKQLIFGGSTENWSVKDFKNGQSKLQKFRMISDLLYPYYKVYILSWKPEELSESQAQETFKASMENMEKIIVLASEIFESDYKYEDFGKLMAEVQKLYPNAISGGSNNTISSSLARYKPLFIYFKKRVFSESISTIKLNQWPVTLKLAQRFFGEYLYFSYFVKGHSPFEDVLPSRLQRWSGSFGETLVVLLKTIPQQKLTKDHLVDFLEALHDADILLNVKAATFRTALDFILNDVLVLPKNRLENKATPDAFTKDSLQILRAELSYWLDAEVALRPFVNNKKKISYLGLRENIDLMLKKTSSASLKLGLSEVLRTIQTNYPMTYDDKGQLIIDRNNRYVFDARGIFMLNITRMISRIIVRSGSENLQRIESYAGITQAEATKVFEPVKSVLIDLGVVSSISPTFINSRFIEANIFMPNSNGDQLVSFEELSDLLGTIFSGLKVNMALEKELKKDCFAGQNLREKVPFSCLGKSYRRHLPEVMTATPQFLDFLKIVSPANWEAYLQGALRGAGEKPDDQGMAAMRDVALIPFVIQYIELVFLKYDLNKNNLIEYQDVQAAFPLFEGLLKTLAQDYIQKGLLSEDDMFPLFCYIIHYGEPPAGVTDYLFKWKPWVNSPSSHQKIFADRSKIAGIIGYIAEKATEGVAVTVH